MCLCGTSFWILPLNKMFANVLDYLRYGSIELPPAIPQTMFKRELDYYGIPANDTSIKDISIAEVIRKFNEEFNIQTKQFNRQKMIHDVFSLAVQCHNRFCQDNRGEYSVNFSILATGVECFKSYGMRQEEAEMLDKYLKEYFGLSAEVKFDTPFQDHCDITVSKL
ncbi:LOW QUALITY PROTEIN: hypothetical protein ACHAW6_004284 [Cyclotella cf. meneghiniana]